MKARHIQNGKVIDFTNDTSAVIEPGTLVMIGNVPAVAADRIEIGATGSCNLGEVFELAKDESNIEQGAEVYYSASTDKVTTTASGNKKIGYAFETAGTSAAAVKVKLSS